MNPVVDRQWDAIIVGAGMGGATLGFALARKGWSVLFLERGWSFLPDREALRTPVNATVNLALAGHRNGEHPLAGNFAETFFDRPAAPGPEHADLLSRAGRWTQVVEDRSTTKPRRFVPFIGAGPGGSSALYGMVLERFHPADFQPRHNFTEATDAAVVDTWPVGYEQLAPYYSHAESLYRVRGTPDPCRPPEPAPPVLGEPRPMSGTSAELFEFLRGKDMHPYRVPEASDRYPSCTGCQGFLCPNACKNDAARVCLVPALRDGDTALLDECDVESLEADDHRVTAVRAVRRGERLTLRARIIVLAAGALATPCVLLRSKSTAWPAGLANQSGLVGRNLMRHYVDLYAVRPRVREGVGSGLKDLAFNDFYLRDGAKLGTVQSFGILPPARVIVAGMEHDLRQTRPWLVPPFKLFKGSLRRILAKEFGRSVILATIMEDLPFHGNRVWPDDQRGTVCVEYRLSQGERRRVAMLRGLMKDVLRPYKVTFIKQAENNERLAHVCGTCRFGSDPATSVLDPGNRAHGVENLYVVDASFFPTSAGTNPALTIAANALRVAETIAR